MDSSPLTREGVHNQRDKRSPSGSDFTPETPPSFQSPQKTTNLGDTSIDSALADASQDQGNHPSPNDLTFVTRVRELSVDSLLEFAQPFLTHSTRNSLTTRQLSKSPSTKSDLGNLPLGPVVEDYFAGIEKDENNVPVGFMGSSRNDLEKATDVLKVKIMALAPSENHEVRSALVQQLILLRLRLQELEDGNEKPAGTFSMGHEFFRPTLFDRSNKLKKHCEVCGQLMFFAPNQSECIKCGYRCHHRCVSSISRNCVAELVERKPELILDICPEKGLDVQNFTCAECRKPFPMDDPNVWESHIRLCEYNGRYFCTVCHRNNAKLTPGNVIKNWDFSPRLVCRESKQLLTLLHFHPILPVLDINKELLVQVEELNRVEEVRGRLAILNRMMLDCVEGPQIALLHLLPSHRKHLMVRNKMYSMNDLVDIERGVLVEELGLFMGELERHVKVTCVSCMGKAQVCVVCWSVTDRLFAFEEAGKVCDKCGAVMHRRCVRNVGDCPNCQGRGRNMGSVVD